MKIYIHTHMDVCMHGCVHVHACTYIHAYIHTYICIYVYIYECVCICVYAYMCAYAWTENPCLKKKGEKSVSESSNIT